MATSEVTLANSIGFQKAGQSEVLLTRMRKEVTALRIEKDSFIEQLDSNRTSTFSSQQQLDELGDKLRESMEDSQEAVDNIRQLEQKIQELEEADAMSSKTIGELTLKVTTMESNLEMISKEKEYIQEKHDIQLKENDTLLVEATQLKKANQDLEIAMQALQLDAQVLIRKVADLTTVNTKLQDALDQLRHETARNEGRYEQMDLQFTELGLLRTQAQQWQQERLSLTEALQTGVRERTEFENRLLAFIGMTRSVVEDLVSEERMKMSVLNSQCQQLQQSLTSKETALSMLQGEQAKSSISAASKQDAVMELKLHIETLTAREAQMASMVTHLQSESTKHAEEVNSWRTKYLELESELKARSVIHQTEIAHLQKDVVSLRDENSQFKLQVASFSSQTEEKVKYSVEITILQEELTKWQIADNVNKQHLAELEAQLAEARMHLKLQSDFEHQVESTLQLCTRAVVALEHKVARQHHLYKMQLTRLTDENTRHVAAVSSLTEENSTLQDDLEHLRGEVSNWRDQYLDLRESSGSILFQRTNLVALSRRIKQAR
jgi:chromosome segregation ATPase